MVLYRRAPSTKSHLGKADVERGARHPSILVLNHHDVQGATTAAGRNAATRRRRSSSREKQKKKGQKQQSGGGQSKSKNPGGVREEKREGVEKRIWKRLNPNLIERVQEIGEEGGGGVVLGLQTRGVRRANILVETAGWAARWERQHIRW